MPLICYNGEFLDASQPLFTADNRGYRYGDGFFETIRVHNGAIPLLDYHLARIEFSLALLQYSAPQKPLHGMVDDILKLCSANQCTTNARVRLSFTNGRGGVFQPAGEMDYLIEASPFPASKNGWNEAGLTIGLYPFMKKSGGPYSNLKSSNFLLNRVAADFAVKNGWDDALLLNQYDNIAETVIANIFWIKDGQVYTPPLSEGCVKGVLRSFLTDQLSSSGNSVKEIYCTPDSLKEADEIFLTNALRGIQWVGNFENRRYDNKITASIGREFLGKIFNAR